MITIASFGGGTDSTAMLIGMVEKREPIGLILFADTGGEKPGTYQHASRFNGWLISHDMPSIITVKSPNVTLEQDCLNRNALPAIVYGYKTCSQRFKIQPIEKYLNNWEPAKEEWAAGQKITRCIGYESGEERRAKEYESDKYINRYPLIEWGWDRAKCIEVIKDAGLPLPGKSACFFCPSSKAQEVLWLKRNHPDLAARAIAMEKNAHLTEIKGLGRNFAWGDLIDFDDRQAKLLDEDWSTAEIPCGCYDGESAPEGDK